MLYSWWAEASPGLPGQLQAAGAPRSPHAVNANGQMRMQNRCRQPCDTFQEAPAPPDQALVNQASRTHCLAWQRQARLTCSHLHVLFGNLPAGRDRIARAY